MKKIDPIQFTENYLKLISQDWMLISVGDKDKFNAMTASWGGVGVLWNKPVVFTFIRPERYTFEFTEKQDYFTISFFDKQYRKALNIFGSESGRKIDKVAKSGLTPMFFEENGHDIPYFAEARIVLECQKLYSDMLESDHFHVKDHISKWYSTHGDFHKMYVSEIINIWVKE